MTHTLTNLRHERGCHSIDDNGQIIVTIKNQSCHLIDDKLVFDLRRSEVLPGDDGTGLFP